MDPGKQLGLAASVIPIYFPFRATRWHRRGILVPEGGLQGREVYWLCKTKQNGSKFLYARFEKMLNTRATWRNINTVRRLAAKYA